MSVQRAVPFCTVALPNWKVLEAVVLLITSSPLESFAMLNVRPTLESLKV